MVFNYTGFTSLNQSEPKIWTLHVCCVRSLSATTRGNPIGLVGHSLVSYEPPWKRHAGCKLREVMLPNICNILRVMAIQHRTSVQNQQL